MGKHEGPQKTEPVRRLEFSKVIVVLATTMWMAVNVFGMVMMAVTRNLSPMVYVLASVDAVMACVCTVYSIKARSENVIKLKKLYGVDTSDIARDSAGSRNSRISFNNSFDSYESYDSSYYGDAPMYEDASIV